MSNENFKMIDSVLSVKASGSLCEDIQNDLLLPPGKTIAELLDDQKENKSDK